MSLSHAETRSLLCKYFQKVIDLREGSKKMEQQYAELEAQFEDQSAYVRKLSTALKHTQLEVERRAAAHQRNYEHKISHVLKQLGDSGGAGGGDRKLRMLEDATGLTHRDNRDLRKHLRGLLSSTPKQGMAPTTGADFGAAGAGAASSLATGAEAAPSTCSSRTPILQPPTYFWSTNLSLSLTVSRNPLRHWLPSGRSPSPVFQTISWIALCIFLASLNKSVPLK